MKLILASDLCRIVVLDISGLYALIYDEATLPSSMIDTYIRQYSDTTKYRIVRI